MKRNNNITGIILAGGKSSRMGSDKGLVRLNGKPFIAHIIAILKPLVKDVIIVSNNSAYDVFNLKRVNDIIENSGPLAGLHTGLFHSETESNLVLSCDIPLISAAVLEKLIRNSDDRFEIVQIKSQDKTMPLIALYKKQCMHLCLELLQKGEKRLRTAVQQFKTKTINLDSELDQDVFNINTTQQLNTLNHGSEH